MLNEEINKYNNLYSQLISAFAELHNQNLIFVRTQGREPGFRCREHRDVINAIEQIDTIKHQACRDWAMTNCDDTVVHPQFDAWFKKLQAHDFYRV